MQKKLTACSRALDATSCSQPALDATSGSQPALVSNLLLLAKKPRHRAFDVGQLSAKLVHGVRDLLGLVKVDVGVGGSGSNIVDLRLEVDEARDDVFEGLVLEIAPARSVRLRHDKELLRLRLKDKRLIYEKNC